MYTCDVFQGASRSRQHMAKTFFERSDNIESASLMFKWDTKPNMTHIHTNRLHAHAHTHNNALTTHRRTQYEFCPVLSECRVEWKELPVVEGVLAGTTGDRFHCPTMSVDPCRFGMMCRGPLYPFWASVHGNGLRRGLSSLRRRTGGYRGLGGRGS